jgi:hypothetical protein
MLHDQADNFVEMGETVEGRLAALLAVPDPTQPFAGHDQFRADEQTYDEPVQHFQQHRVLVECQQFLFKLFQVTGQIRHCASSSLRGRPGGIKYEFTRFESGSKAVMRSAFVRGYMAAGPDGFRERHPFRATA